MSIKVTWADPRSGDSDKFDDFYPPEEYTHDGITLRGGGMCPEQYDAFNEDGNLVGYLRLRHGKFTVECPDVGGELVLFGSPIGDGVFDDDERTEWLNKAIAAIHQYWWPV